LQLILSVAAIFCALSSRHIEICISFVFFELRRVNAQSGPAFVTCNKRICAVWPLVTVVQQKEYVRILWLMDTSRVTKEYMTTRHGYITYNNCACNSTSVGNRSILTCLRVKLCGHFGFDDLYVAKKCKSILENNIFMYQLNLLFVACRTASSSKAWFWFSTDRQYFFIFPAFLGSLLWVLFWEYYFCFSQKKVYSKSHKFVFQVKWACQLLSNCWVVEKLAWVS